MDSKKKWNEKYIARLNESEAIAANERLLKLSPIFQGGLALDFACGLGANSIHLAKLGYQVDAYDISDVAINHLKERIDADNLAIYPKVYDLENVKSLNINENNFDVVVITYYLDREVFPLMKSIVKKGGYFFMETFYASPTAKKEGVSDKFKLRSQELLTIFSDWQIIFYEENEEEGRQTILVRK